MPDISEKNLTEAIETAFSDGYNQALADLVDDGALTRERANMQANRAAWIENVLILFCAVASEDQPYEDPNPIILQVSANIAGYWEHNDGTADGINEFVELDRGADGISGWEQGFYVWEGKLKVQRPADIAWHRFQTQGEWRPASREDLKNAGFCI